MSDGAMARVQAVAAARVRDVIAALAEAARAELPASLAVETREDGVAITGRGLATSLAFDARLRSFIDAVRR